MIILGDLRVRSHSALANRLQELGFHTILQNENNLKVRRFDGGLSFIPWSIRKKVVRNVLYEMFNLHKLWDGPIALIGFKKIDRGLGYHYAPPNGGNGLIWDNEIMGHIDGLANRVQRVSRTHGVIAQCPEYAGVLHYWIDERTELTVRNQNNIIKSLHDNYHGFHSLRERLEHAKKATPLLTKEANYKISVDSFDSQVAAHVWYNREMRSALSALLGFNYGISNHGLIADGVRVPEGTPNITEFTYRSGTRQITDEATVRASTDLGQGSNTSARVMPFLEGGLIKFVVIYIERAAPVPAQVLGPAQANEFINA